MAKVEKRTARSDIYHYGLKTPCDKNKSGFKYERSKPRNDHDPILVKKGQEYYTWSLFGDSMPRISLTYPKRQQLTNSEFKISVYDLEDRISDLSDGTFEEVDDLQSEDVS